MSNEAECERIPYFELSDAEKEALHDWAKLHDVNHLFIPTEGTVELDLVTDEWCIEMYVQDGEGGYLFSGDEPVMTMVRRQAKADLPWPTRVRD
jgi:hypothetical protein